MDRSELKARLRKQIQPEFEALLDRAAQSICEATPGRVIAESEERYGTRRPNFASDCFKKALRCGCRPKGLLFPPRKVAEPGTSRNKGSGMRWDQPNDKDAELIAPIFEEVLSEEKALWKSLIISPLLRGYILIKIYFDKPRTFRYDQYSFV